jgi:thioredoxin 1
MSGINKHSQAITKGGFDLDTALKSKKKVFALFYATWCPFSQQFLPYFQKHAEGKGHDCVKITIDDKQSLFDKYHVEYMPTVIYFKDGKPARRLDATPRVGLSEKQLLELLEKCR